MPRRQTPDACIALRAIAYHPGGKQRIRRPCTGCHASERCAAAACGRRVCLSVMRRRYTPARGTGKAAHQGVSWCGARGSSGPTRRNRIRPSSITRASLQCEFACGGSTRHCRRLRSCSPPRRTGMVALLRARVVNEGVSCSTLVYARNRGKKDAPVCFMAWRSMLLERVETYGHPGW